MGGLANLKLENIDLNNNRATVYEKGKGGNAKKRIVFYGDRTSNALSLLITQRPLDHEIDQTAVSDLFSGSRRSKGYYQQLSENGIYQVLKRLARDWGTDKGFNLHNLRHDVIRGRLSNGMPLLLASQLAGHSSVTVTADIDGTANETELSNAHKHYTWKEQESALDYSSYKPLVGGSNPPFATFNLIFHRKINKDISVSASIPMTNKAQ